MYFVYILYSEKCRRYYVGYSCDVEARLLCHNAGMVNATKNCRPYVLKMKKEFECESQTEAEEKRVKRMKCSKYIG